MGHVVLLGDSIFDNQSYIAPGEPPVIAQVRARLPVGWKATLLAVDGSTVDDVARQLNRLAEDASHIVVSAGGNDALGHMGLLTEGARSVAEVLERLAEISASFERSYRQMTDAVLRHRVATALCTIYHPAFPDAEMQRLTVAGLMVFNDSILRVAAGAGLPALDLRLICTAPGDYANPIEPSAAGGEKIAAAIAALVTEHDFTRQRTAIFVHEAAR
jgi:lysophospholipase L1-like esterase